MALLSLADYQSQWLGGDTSDATARQALLDGLAEEIARWLGYPATSTGTYTVESASYVQIEGENPFSPFYGSAHVRLAAAPVSAVSEVMIVADGDFSAGTALTSDDYQTRDLLSMDRARVQLTGVSITDGDAIRVSYTAGHSSIPAGLKRAFGDYVFWADLLRGRRGEASQASTGRVTKSYRPEDMPPDIAARLMAYRAPGGRL